MAQQGAELRSCIELPPTVPELLHSSCMFLLLGEASVLRVLELSLADQV